MLQAQVFYRIRPTDQARRETWQELLNRDTLPVEDPRPFVGQGGKLVYHVATQALSDMERARLAGFIARQNGGGYLDALDQVASGVAVPALGCELIEENNVFA